MQRLSIAVAFLDPGQVTGAINVLTYKVCTVETAQLKY